MALWEVEGFANMRTDYTKSHSQINPFGITPLGPVPDILPKDEEVPSVKFAAKI